MIERLEQEAAAQLPAAAPMGAMVAVRGQHEGREIEVRFRVNRRGDRVYGYSYGGARMARSTLLLLTCPEAACQASREARQRWLEFIGEGERPRRAVVSSLAPVPLIDEVPIRIRERSFVARPASFESVTTCPRGAHEARAMRRQGWDLFEGGRCIAGGVVMDERAQGLVPKFPRLADAAAWLAEVAAASPPGRRGPGWQRRDRP